MQRAESEKICEVELKGMYGSVRVVRDNLRYDLLRTGDVQLTSNKILERGFLPAVRLLRLAGSVRNLLSLEFTIPASASILYYLSPYGRANRTRPT